MNMPVDRPCPVDYIHPDGTKAKIDFQWGAADNPIPRGIRVTFDDPDLPGIHEEEVYASYEEARARGIKMTIEWIERSSG